MFPIEYQAEPPALLYEFQPYTEEQKLEGHTLPVVRTLLVLQNPQGIIFVSQNISTASWGISDRAEVDFSFLQSFKDMAPQRRT